MGLFTKREVLLNVPFKDRIRGHHAADIFRHMADAIEHSLDVWDINIALTKVEKAKPEASDERE